MNFSAWEIRRISNSAFPAKLSLLGEGRERWTRVHVSFDFQFSFEFCDALFERAYQFLDFLGSIARRDVFGTVPVEGKHLNEKQACHDAVNVRFGQVLDEVRMLARVLNTGVTKNFESRALRIVHQEERYAVVGGEISGGKHLAIAPIISKDQRVRIQNAKEAGTSTSMLDVRPSVFADSRHVKTVASPDERGFVLRQRILFRRAGNARRASEVVLLRFTHGICDGVFEKIH